MQAIFVPNDKRQLPPAVAYMMRQRRSQVINHARYSQVLYQNRACAGGDPYDNCYKCPFATLCAALFDGVVDRCLWYGKGGDNAA